MIKYTLFFLSRLNHILMKRYSKYSWIPLKWHLTRLICESSIENTFHSCLRFAFQRTLISFIKGSKLWPLDVLFLLGINMKFDHIVTWYDEHKKVEEFIYLISFPYLKKRTVYNLNRSKNFLYIFDNNE